jgi:predicted RNase H-like HicB family nuclease
VSEVRRYPKQLFWSDEDGGFVAIAPDLPGCSAFGDTEQKAISELDDAIVAWIHAAKVAGNAVPKPSRPAERRQFSGKILVRMPRELHGELVEAAENEDVSLNQYIVFLLTRSSVVHYKPASGVTGNLLNDVRGVWSCLESGHKVMSSNSDYSRHGTAMLWGNAYLTNTLGPPLVVSSASGAITKADVNKIVNYMNPWTPEKLSQRTNDVQRHTQEIE